jgi:hypothetical protein
MRFFNLADSTGLAVPSSAWAIPAAVMKPPNGGAPPQMAAPPGEANGDDQPARVGHNSGNTTPMADNNKDAKAAAIAEIRDWLANRLDRASDYMTPAEIGAAENRLILLKHALIDGVAYIQRALNALDDDAKKRGTTLVAEVYIYSALFSDNGSGYSQLAASRLAKMLDCSVRAIKYARALLVEMRVLGREQCSGLESRYWPIINRKLASGYVHPTWWFDATSEPIKRGRQSEQPMHQACTGLGEETGAPVVHGSGETRAPSVHVSKETHAPLRKTRAPGSSQPIENKGNAGLYFTREFTKEREGADAPPAAKGGDARRGMRLPEDWALPEGWHAHPRQRGLSEQQIAAVAKKFRGHWTTVPGQKALKLNWQRVWENWVDNEIDKYGLKPAGTAQAQHSSEDAWVAEQMRSPKGIERAKSMDSEAHEKMLREAYRQTMKGVRT